MLNIIMRIETDTSLFFKLIRIRKFAAFFFQISGFVLMSLGGLLLADNERVLLSRLLGPGDIHPEQPLFYYLAFAVVALGFFIAITGLLGCWAACLFNRCITISVRFMCHTLTLYKISLIRLIICALIFYSVHRVCFFDNFNNILYKFFLK